MVMTKAQQKAALKHVIESVFDEQPNDSCSMPNLLAQFYAF
jgi:hypothetical protein